MTQTLSNYIGGQFVPSRSETTDPVYNPATEEILAYVPLSTKEEVDQAVQEAAKAGRAWAKTAVPRRARILFKYQQALVEHWEELARLITAENGKSYAEAYGEVRRHRMRGVCGRSAYADDGQALPDIATNLESGMYRYPVGVVAGITPFNFPMMVPCWMFRSPSLAAMRSC